MNKKINDFQNKWDSIISSYDGDFRSDDDVDKFFSGEYYKAPNQNKELMDNALPEPYLGDPYNNSIVCLNLNPGKYLEKIQHPVDGIFVAKGNAIKSYSTFAKGFPYLQDKYKIDEKGKQNDGHKWWESRNKYFKRLFNYDGNKSPFALEICPWRSSEFGRLKTNKEFKDYVKENIIDIASEVSLNSDIKIVFSVGAPFRRIFERLKDRFKLIKELTQDNAEEHGYNFPVKEDGHLVNRRISIWLDKEYEVYYLNTSAQGGNKNPAQNFDKIIQKLIAEHK